MSLAHILERSSGGICLLCVVGPTSSATLEFPEDTLVMLPFHFLFTRKPTPACPLLASEWYSRWPLCTVVKLSSFLRTSPSPVTTRNEATPGNEAKKTLPENVANFVGGYIFWEPHTQK